MKPDLATAAPQQAFDRQRVIHRFAAPARCDRRGCNPDLALPVVFYHGASAESSLDGKVGAETRAIRLTEHEQPVIGSSNTKPAFMYDMMMVVTQRDQIREFRFTAIGPVLDVMPFGEARVMASREAAATIACLQGTGNSWGYGAGLAADAQRLAVFVVEHADHRGIAGEPACSFNSERLRVLVLAQMYMCVCIHVRT